MLDLPPFVLCEFTLPAQLPTQLLAATKDRTKAAPGGLSLGPVEAERSAGPRLSPGSQGVSRAWPAIAEAYLSRLSEATVRLSYS